MKKGDKVRLDVKVSDFDVEKRTGVIVDIIKSKIKNDLYAVEVSGQVCYRWEKELKKV